MIITCPNCGFSRDVSISAIPKHSPTAICPKCHSRFPIKVTRPPEPANPDEEQEMRAFAARAYSEEAERFRDEQPQDLIPWELAPRELSWPAAFIQTALRVMFAAPQFFSRLLPETNKMRPLAFFVLVALFETLINTMWGNALFRVLAPGIFEDPQLQTLLSSLEPRSDWLRLSLMQCAFQILQLYLISSILYLAFRTMTDRSKFALIFQVLAYSSAPALLSIVPILGSMAGNCWTLVCVLIGCRTALHLSWPKTLLGFLPVLLLGLLGMFWLTSQLANLKIGA